MGRSRLNRYPAAPVVNPSLKLPPLRAAVPPPSKPTTAPALLLQAGTSDCVVPYLQNQELFDALLPVVSAERVQLTLMKGWNHGDSRFDGPDNLETVGAFLTKALQGPREPNGV